MSGCNDPTVKYLAEFGFNVVRLPRANLAPGDVLVGKGPQLERLGGISGVWESEQEPPLAKEPVAAAMLKGQRTGTFDLDVGLSLLGRLLSGVGVSEPKLKVAFAKAEQLSFGFGCPEIQAIEPLDLGAFLAKGALRMDNPIVAHYFGEGQPPVHAITDLLLSSSMTVIATREAGASLDLKLGVIEEAVECNVGFKKKGVREAEISFVGHVKLVFGFRAIRLEPHGSGWRMRGFAPPGAVFGAAPPSPKKWASRFPLGEASIQDVGDSA